MEKKEHKVKTYQGAEYESYSDYLSTSHWLTVRVEVLKQKNRCTICKGTKDLHVTHKHFYHNGSKKRAAGSILGRERVSDMRVLCKECHDLIHDYRLDEVLRQNKILTAEHLSRWVDERKAGNTSNTLRSSCDKGTTAKSRKGSASALTTKTTMEMPDLSAVKPYPYTNGKSFQHRFALAKKHLQTVGVQILDAEWHRRSVDDQLQQHYEKQLRKTEDKRWLAVSEASYRSMIAGKDFFVSFGIMIGKNTKSSSYAKRVEAFTKDAITILAKYGISTTILKAAEGMLKVMPN
jgi:5-methylcytosine-specific restriction endonuclease McrA